MVLASLCDIEMLSGQLLEWPGQQHKNHLKKGRSLITLMHPLKKALGWTCEVARLCRLHALANKATHELS